MQPDRQLLLGLLALQCGLISDDQLVAAFRAWASDKQRSIEAILIEQKALSSHQLAVLRQLEAEVLAQHGQSAEQSLATLSRISSVRQELEALADPQLCATLSRLPAHSKSVSGSKTRGGDQASRGEIALRYQTIRLHAKGGIGEVFVAKDGELNREVALKEIQEQFADHDESRARFKLEAEITGNLEHPGIVPVYGLGQYQDGRPYYAMRFIRGDSLKEAIDAIHGKYKDQLIEGEAGLELRKLLRRFVDVCNAIAYAHSRGVLHRDLKPGNIILGKYGETLVVDWGLARAQGQSESTDASIGPIVPSSGSGVTPTLVGSAVGTPAYMSPEQAAGKVDDLGPATDVYALGATLFHLLTGQLPITGKTLLEIVQKAENGEIRRPRALRSDVPKSLEAICIKAMAKEPDQRYASPVQFAEDIEKWLADEPVSAYTEPISIRLRRWIRRHPAIVSTSAAVILLSLAGALLFAFIQGAHAKVLEGKNKTISDQVVEVTKQKQEVEKERTRAEEREQDAIAAVKRFGDAVSNNKELKDNPKLESLRKELLKEPLGFFKTLKDRLQAENSTRKASLASLASAAFDLGSLTDEIGDKQDAIKAYKESLAIRERQAREDPTVAQYASDLAISHLALGTMLRDTGNSAEALTAYEKAKKIQEQLARENPTISLFASDLALTHINLGILLNQIGKPTEALTSFVDAKNIWERLSRENPTVTKFASELAASHNNLGAVLRETGKLPDALAAFEDSIKIQEQLARENPTLPQYASDLAACHANLGLLLSQVGKFEEALKAHEEAKEIQDRLVRENPTVTQYARDLASNYNAIASLLNTASQQSEAIAAYEEAKTIQERLAQDNPTVPQYASDLARSINNLAILFYQGGKTSKALAAFEESMKIQERLARENPAVPQYTSALAASHNNLGLLLRHAGKLAEALAAFEESMKIYKRLAEKNSTVIQHVNDLAESHNNIAVLLQQMGRHNEALAAYKEASQIQVRLARENPTMTQYANDLASTENSLGNLLHKTGKLEDALAAHEQARKIRERLVEENPTVIEFQSALGATLNNIALLKLDAKAFLDAKLLASRAIDHQKRALAANPTHPTYRQFLKNHYVALQRAANGLKDDALFVEAQRGLNELTTSDPRFAELDQRLTEVANGAAAKSVAELRSLGQRAYDTRKYKIAAWLFSEALVQDGNLEKNRETQIRYNAACSAALAVSGQGEQNPPLDDAAKTKLRSQALTWLKQELAQWQKFLGEDPKPEAKQAVAQTLAHWQKDSDLSSIRDAEKLATLPEPERKDWEALWTEVKALEIKATAAPAATPPLETQPAENPPADSRSPPPT